MVFNTPTFWYWAARITRCSSRCCSGWLRRMSFRRFRGVDRARRGCLLRRAPCAFNAKNGVGRRLKFFATDSVEKFRRLGARFLGRPIEDVEHVDLKE